MSGKSRYMTIASLVFLRRGNEILLTYKKRGFGKDKWNGPGGKVKNESVEEGAIREIKEEIDVDLVNMDHVAILTFYNDGIFDWTVHVFISWEFIGTPTEGDEVRPKWYSIDKIPYDSMWEDDKYWLPRVLAGEKLIGYFYFSKGLKKLERFDLHKMDKLS